MEKLFVIKIGGNVIDREPALESFLAAFASVPGRKILIHGGGALATKIGEQLAIDSKYVNGRRITDAATLNLVTMVYGGLINKQVVAKLQQRGVNAMGLTGADGKLIQATRRPAGEVDYGFVGDLNSDSVNRPLLATLLAQGVVPVVAPLTLGEGTMLNTNADTIASALAVAMGDTHHVRLVYCFEKTGVLENVQDPSSVISHLNGKRYAELLAAGALHDGILPKLENAFAAIRAGVREVLIGDAADLTENIGPETKGTLITA